MMKADNDCDSDWQAGYDMGLKHGKSEVLKKARELLTENSNVVEDNVVNEYRWGWQQALKRLIDCFSGDAE